MSAARAPRLLPERARVRREHAAQATSAAAVALSAPVRAADAPLNAVTDAMNAGVPWLWWPLAVPAASEPLPLAAHGLYVVHAVAL